jgi:L-lactate dehydrogenase complex protein LldF
MPAERIQVEAIARAKSADSRRAVREATEKRYAQRESALAGLRNAAEMRALASSYRRHALDHLGHYLRRAEAQLTANGVRVHWAADAAEARAIVREICRAANAKLIAKSKSMVTEEIELNAALEQAGYRPIETDLGEFVIQLDGDHPCHIVLPMIHVDRRKVGKLFHEHGLGEPTEDPEALTMQARRHLRAVFEQAGVGISGANYVVADSGTIVTISNEGNLRLTTNLPRVHIAVTGIEKIVARQEHLAALLQLHARSATGQALTVYTQFLRGPRRPGEAGGPEEMHLIFLDNGRSALLGGEYQEMLQCIRCGACLNVCPVFRAATGHAYGGVYPGPMGAVLSPLLGGEESLSKFAQLPKASSLCAACEEVCPVAIPIPRMLLSLRGDLHRRQLKSGADPPWGPWAALATRPRLWRAALGAGKLSRATGYGALRLAPMRSIRSWLDQRDLPEWPRRSFRQWWRSRQS